LIKAGLLTRDISVRSRTGPASKRAKAALYEAPWCTLARWPVRQIS
jgi:hypothetical protein